MKKFILAAAIVATSFGAFAVQTPANSKKVVTKTEKKAAHKAKKEETKKDEAKKVMTTPKAKKGK